MERHGDAVKKRGVGRVISQRSRCGSPGRHAVAPLNLPWIRITKYLLGIVANAIYAAQNTKYKMRMFIEDCLLCRKETDEMRLCCFLVPKIFNKQSINNTFYISVFLFCLLFAISKNCSFDEFIINFKLMIISSSSSCDSFIFYLNLSFKVIFIANFNDT